MVDNVKEMPYIKPVKRKSVQYKNENMHLTACLHGEMKSTTQVNTVRQGRKEAQPNL